MSSNPARYSIGDLAGLVGSTPRTIRYYVAQGLLPPPDGAGSGAHYTDDHLGRLRLIQRLQRQHQPLSEIRERLAQLDAREVSALVADGEPEGPADSALDYVRSVLAGPAATISRPASPKPAPAPPDATAPPPGLPVAAPGAQPAAALLYRQKAARRLFVRPSIPLPDDVVSMPAEIRLAEASPGYPMQADASGAGGTPEPDVQTPEQRSQWDRIGLTPNIEIHVRRPLSRLENRRVERLITIARHMLREEKP
jgi:DNA-binding transcriptional MerR regulator